ncbi:PQQ-dependent sugar dehydrogenase [Micromonospora sp. Llam7]|uniref:PQQ-dependent sugar dehydrogenase n=1 Tax=Micromonospora tarapacensis TaxID=2835305 RepID=UPI001C8391C0|nr:PQQ-dependent sugar dehydrogenase [Micromonospora tarapacensis]MBX7267645.1 PQQ-dependent sugar dehydrogenase [Micromonospora tarapacensis]
MSTPDSRFGRRLSSAGSALLMVAAAGAIAIAGSTPPAAAAISAADYQQVTLAKGIAEMGEPMSLAVLPDRSVLHTARNGTLRRTDAAGNTAVIGTLAVYSHDEDGLQGVGVDPSFASNRHIYLYYAPPLNTPGGDAPGTGTNWSAWQGVNRLSRFTLDSDWTLDRASEVTILDVAADRGQCCHAGGDIDFDAAGNLYLSTGDDTNPFESAGYSPLDERTNRNPAYDAQRSAANTNDLRGKILRVKINANGSYSIPAGNMFAPGTARTRPEIYAMGLRNPFRMSVDKATGVVYVGDYGPDAGVTSNRGPSGQVEFNRITGPGFYGWPYCTGTNTSNETYAEWDFNSNSAGGRYNCAGGPTNNSFRNTGLSTLPAAKPAWIRYAGDSGSPSEFGGGSESPMAGPVYRYDPNNPSTTKFPQSLDGQFFAGEFGRGWIKPIQINADGSRGAIDNFPWVGKQVMDMAFGPDGALYVLDYGTGFYNGDANSALYRFDYVGPAGNRAPTAVVSADKTSGQAPLTVSFSSAGSSDPEGGTLSYSWNLGDGTTSTAANPSKTYAANGTYHVTLTVRDPQGATGTANVQVGVGNTAPTVTITTPVNGTLFSYGDTVPYTITVSDPEDATIDCARVKLTYVLGHDQHGHAITSKNGCSGSITIPVDGEHDNAANIFGIFDAEYTDNGGLTTHKQHTLQPRHRQAEHYKASAGVATFGKATAEGGTTVGNIENGDWIAFEPYRLDNASSFTARVSSAGSGGTLQLRAGSATGTVLGSATVPNTGGWETFTNVTGTISGAPAGTTTLYLTFAGGTGFLYDVDAFTVDIGSSSVRTGRIVGLGGKCLEAAGGSSANGTQIQIWSCNDGTNQQWTVTPNSTINALNKCLDINAGSATNGTKIQLWTCNGGPNQNWSTQTDGSLRNPQTGKCLDVSNNSSTDGQAVHLWSCHGGANQKWTLP